MSRTLPSTPPPGERTQRWLKDWLKQHAPGDLLPTEGELVQVLEVSRSTVRVALQRLEDEGRIKALPSRRRAAAGPVSAAQAGLLKGTVLVLSRTAPEHQRRGREALAGFDKFVHIGAMAGIETVGAHAWVLNPEASDFQPSRLLELHPRGVMVLTGVLEMPAIQDVLHAFRSRRVPVVVYGSGPLAEPFDRVYSDHAQGAYELTRWLAARGRKRILRLWLRSRGEHVRPAWLGQRDVGYLRAIGELGLPEIPTAEVLTPVRAVSDAVEYEAVTRLAAGFLLPHLKGEHAIDAVMAISDGAAFAAASALRLLGGEPHRGVIVTGYDNYWRDAWERQWELVGPLASVEKNNLYLGEQMASLLVERERCGWTVAAMERLVPPQLIDLTQGP